MVGARTGRGARRAAAGALAGLLAAALLAIAGPAAEAGAPPAPPPPTPTPARANDPADVYGVGDSISTATGTGNLGAETPRNSWITGLNVSPVSSMRERLGLPESAGITLATNGRRMQDFDDQANQLPSNATYVVVELGGNDLCRPTVAEMTSVAEYRTQLQNGLAAVRAHAPDALIFLASIPDIYNLWYLRGAESPYNPQPSSRRSGLNGAHFYWDGVSVIPCQSLVADPTDSSPAATARRLAVRQRTLDFNAVIAEECGAVLRCRTDDGRLFELSSNRIDPYANVEPGPNGYLPRDQWQFEDLDISRNRDDDGFPDLSGLCPLPGVVSGGTVCGDHFHPSLEGQNKLAQAGHESSYQFGDNSFPDPTLTPQRAPDGLGVYAGPVTVDVTATDDVAVRGYEHRVHHPNGTVDAWTEHVGTTVSVPVTEAGTTHVEVRAFDVNGNRSASEHTTITIEPGSFAPLSGSVLEQGTSAPLVATVELHDAAGEGVLATTTSDGAFSFPNVHVDQQVRIHVVDEDGSHVSEWAQNADTHADATTYAVDEYVDVRLERVHECTQGFSDVSATHPFRSDICWLVGEEITTGYSDGTFRPAAPVTRQAMAAFLHRLVGSPLILEHETPTFRDVGTSHPFYDEIEWAEDEGVIAGFPDGTFRPSASVSRQAMAAFMFRLVDPDGWTPPGSASFSDVGPGHPFFSEVEWLVAEDIANGYDDGTFRPSASVTRQSMAAFLHRVAALRA
jgi:lysophospholipase L1-like esterase